MTDYPESRRVAITFRREDLQNIEKLREQYVKARRFTNLRITTGDVVRVALQDAAEQGDATA